MISDWSLPWMAATSPCLPWCIPIWWMHDCASSGDHGWWWKDQLVDKFLFPEWDNSLAKRDRTLHLCLISAKGQRLHQGVAPLPQLYFALYFNIVQEKLFASMLYNRQDYLKLDCCYYTIDNILPCFLPGCVWSSWSDCLLHWGWLWSWGLLLIILMLKMIVARLDICRPLHSRWLQFPTGTSKSGFPRQFYFLLLRCSLSGWRLWKCMTSMEGKGWRGRRSWSRRRNKRKRRISEMVRCVLCVRQRYHASYFVIVLQIR